MLRETAITAAVLLTVGAAGGTVLSGVVRDAGSGAPVAGAIVTVGDTLGTVCDDAGQFRLTVPPGVHEVAASRIGYADLRRRLEVSTAGLDTVVLELQTQPLVMPETQVHRRAPRAPRFVEVSAAAGLHFRHDYGGPRVANILQATGAGVCFFDADGDGRQDLYLVNGATLVGTADPAPTNAYYANVGGGAFVDVTTAVGLGDGGYGMGCAAADYDGDGDRDLYVTNYGANVLYRNDGAMPPVFDEVTISAGVGDGRWSVGAAWADIDNDGSLDLFVGNYLDFDVVAPPVRSMASLHEGFRAYAGPRDYDGQPDAMFLNRGDGTLVDAADDLGLNRHVGKAMGCAFGDYDDDGDADLFVANDRTRNNFYRNDGGRFTEIGLQAGVAVDEEGHKSGAMGVDFGDYDLDGRFDLFVSNFAFEYNSLYRNVGDGTFADATATAGLAEPSYRYVGWGSLFFDYDNDGDVDIFVANGDVHEDMDLLNQGITFEQPDQLFRNDGDGTFADVSEAAGLRTAGPAVGRGAAAADIDDDGDLDILVSNAGGQPHLWRNDGGNLDHWLSLRLLGQSGHADAIGARLTIQAGALTLSRQLHSGHSYLSQGDGRIYVGLGGQLTVPQLTICWPSGEVESIGDLPLDRHLTVTQGQGIQRTGDSTAWGEISP